MYNAPLAYFITFTCYGTWLHGDERWAVDDEHNKYGLEFVAPDTKRQTNEKTLLKNETSILTPHQRVLVRETIHEVCQFRAWLLHVANVRTNHVHVVVSGDAKPEKMMADFKRYATRKLVEENEFSKETKIWTRYGSTRYLWNESSVANACRYVEEQ